MSIPHKSTFVTLPYDLIHEICTHIPNTDFQNLKLVCKDLLSALPAFRINQCQRTIFFVQREIDLLKALGSGSREQRNRIGHIVFDLSSPYVQFGDQSSEYDKSIHRYPRLDRLLDVCGGWVARAGRPMWSSFSLSHREDKPTLRHGGTGSKRTSIEPADTNLPLESQIKLKFQGLVGTQLQSITEIDYPDLEEFFQTLTETLKTLPNLRTLEIRSNGIENASKISTFWKRYDPNIKAFFLKNPELENLSWLNRFEVIKPMCSKQIRFGQAYMGLLHCAANAQCQISEIRINAPNILQCEEGFIADNLRQLLSRPKSEQYVGLYKDTFANITHLEIPILLWRCYCGGFRQNLPPSLLFLALLRNVEELVITRLRVRYSHYYEWEFQPDLFVPGDLILPRLRRLEIIEIGILHPVVQFLKANKASLRKLVCISTFNQRVLRVDMIEILSAIHHDLDLDYYRIDFLTNKDIGKLCYLCVEVRKSCGETGFEKDKKYNYRVGTKCEFQSRVGYSAESEESHLQTNQSRWMNKTTWEEFISGVQEITAGVCKEHWDGDMKPASALLCY